MKSVIPVMCMAAALTSVTLPFAPSLSAATANDAQVGRGRYLVTQVGMCADCHSPRGPDGAFVAGRDLTGAPLGFAPSVPMPWAPAAPSIAGLPAGYSDSDLIQFLMTGKRPHEKPPALPPMPEYRFNREDAAAITAYLKTLKPAN